MEKCEDCKHYRLINGRFSCNEVDCKNKDKFEPARFSEWLLWMKGDYDTRRKK